MHVGVCCSWSSSFIWLVSKIVHKFDHMDGPVLAVLFCSSFGICV